MSGVVDWAGDLLLGAARIGGDIVEVVGEFAVDAYEAIGDAISSVKDALGPVGEFVGTMVERYAIQAAMVAMGIPPAYAAPMSAGLHTIARGGSAEDALKSAATVAVIQQTSDAIATGMQAANADAIAQGGQAIYSAAEIAAATSAASSAIATAAAGGDIEAVLKGAGIGAVTGATATEVYKQTGSLEAANFTRVAMQASLQGVKLEQAILMGASSAMVVYLDNMSKTALRATEVANSRNASIKAYQNRVDSYYNNKELADRAAGAASSVQNRMPVEPMRPFTNNPSDLQNYEMQMANYRLEVNFAQQEAARLQAQAANYQNLANQDLEVIRNLADQIGNFNQQLKDITDEYLREQSKAQEEAKKTKFEFEERTRAQLTEEQEYRDALANELIKQYADVEARRFGYEGIDIAGGELPYGLEASLRSEPLLVNQERRFGAPQETTDSIRQQIVGTLPNGEEYSYTIVTDKADGSIFYEYGSAGDANINVIASDNRPVFRLDQGGAVSVTEFADPELLGEVPTITERELQQINEAATGARGETLRGAAETYLFEQELVDLEKELKASRDAAAQEAIRADFVRQQRDRLAKTQRLSGTVQAQINAELESILDEYERTKGEAAEKAATKERIVASQQERAGTVSDEDVMRLLGLSPEEGEKYGLRPGGGGAGYSGVPAGVLEPEEGALEGEMELGGGEGEGEPTEPAEQRFDAQGRLITTTATVRPERQLGGRGETPGIPSRVTGEALVGILGEKEPLFGGDEDEQRAVWNRRSLRLRKALGL